MKGILTFVLLFILFDAFGQLGIFENYPAIIDSIIIQKRTNEEVIVIQNKNGSRKEFWFDQKGSRKLDVTEFYLKTADNKNFYKEIDSSFYFNDSIFCLHYIGDTLKYTSTTFINPTNDLHKHNYISISEHELTRIFKNKSDSTGFYLNSKILKQHGKYSYQEDITTFKKYKFKDTKVIVVDTLNYLFVMDSTDWFKNFKLAFKKDKISKINFFNYYSEPKNEQKVIEEGLSRDSFWLYFNVYYYENKKKIAKRKKIKASNRDIYQDIIIR